MPDNEGKEGKGFGPRTTTQPLAQANKTRATCPLTISTSGMLSLEDLAPQSLNMKMEKEGGNSSKHILAFSHPFFPSLSLFISVFQSLLLCHQIDHPITVIMGEDLLLRISKPLEALL
ncbi:hypothetical protein D8674_021764 [Pyrus ussuriensis x Pyrus communis]|uniref:Uncharacterized protein n=1 Tax=Pyrus ussuriensis x Pyrus communis TaxID=2448454 RepID=A0A5N5GI13_9ROSA|nr:hypothetical protein D8674_021764 [Pyrus ussuriensis x Pyrus communis]